MTEQADLSENQTNQSVESSATTEDTTSTPSRSSETVTIKRTTLNYIVIAIVFFAIGLLIGGASFGTASVDSETIESAVESVLVDAGIMQPPANMDILVDDDPFLGPADAPIVIVEFSAYACPYCQRHFEDTLAPLLETYSDYVRYVYRDFPTINPNVSFPASLAANCAREQGQFWEYHDLLFTNQSTLLQGGQSFLTQLASDLGLDTEQFNNCLIQQDYLYEVEGDFDAGIAVGVSGTPAFYINGQAHSGARPYAYFEGIILRELEALGINPNASPNA
ncbi:MAG: thioredoxin domain-containing protein [Chloroflexota bacterium]